MGKMQFQIYAILLSILVLYSSSAEIEKDANAADEDNVEDGLISHWKWPQGGDGHYHIPFEFGGDIKNTPHLRGQILEAMLMVQQNTCIRFEDREDAKGAKEAAASNDFVQFFIGKKCRTQIGHSHGPNPLELADECEMAPSIMKMLCLKIGINNNDNSQVAVEKINQIYPCHLANEWKGNAEKPTGDGEAKEDTSAGEKGRRLPHDVASKIDPIGNFFGYFNSAEKSNEKIATPNEKLTEEMEDAVEEMEKEAFYLEEFEREDEEKGEEGEAGMEEMDGGREQTPRRIEELMKGKEDEEEMERQQDYGGEDDDGIGPDNGRPNMIEELVKEGVLVDDEEEEVKRGDGINETKKVDKNGIENSNILREPLILIAFILYVLLASAFIGRILMKCCANDSDEMDKPIGGRRKSSLGRRLRHFSWDASAFGAHQREREEKGDQSSQSRPQSPIPTISSGDLRRISVVNFQLPSNGKEYLTVPIYEGLS